MLSVQCVTEVGLNTCKEPPTNEVISCNRHAQGRLGTASPMQFDATTDLSCWDTIKLHALFKPSFSFRQRADVDRK